MSRLSVAKSLIHAFINEDAHLGACEEQFFGFFKGASSRAATAASRETVGNPSRKSSRVSPPSRWSTNAWMGRNSAQLVKIFGYLKLSVPTMSKN